MRDLVVACYGCHSVALRMILADIHRKHGDANAKDLLLETEDNFKIGTVVQSAQTWRIAPSENNDNISKSGGLFHFTEWRTHNKNGAGLDTLRTSLFFADVFLVALPLAAEAPPPPSLIKDLGVVLDLLRTHPEVRCGAAGSNKNPVVIFTGSTKAHAAQTVPWIETLAREHHIEASFVVLPPTESAGLDAAPLLRELGRHHAAMRAKHVDPHGDDDDVADKKNEAATSKQPQPQPQPQDFFRVLAFGCSIEYPTPNAAPGAPKSRRALVRVLHPAGLVKGETLVSFLATNLAATYRVSKWRRFGAAGAANTNTSTPEAGEVVLMDFQKCRLHSPRDGGNTMVKNGSFFCESPLLVDAKSNLSCDVRPSVFADIHDPSPVALPARMLFAEVADPRLAEYMMRKPGRVIEIFGFGGHSQATVSFFSEKVRARVTEELKKKEEKDDATAASPTSSFTPAKIVLTVFTSHKCDPVLLSKMDRARVRKLAVRVSINESTAITSTIDVVAHARATDLARNLLSRLSAQSRTADPKKSPTLTQVVNSVFTAPAAGFDADAGWDPLAICKDAKPDSSIIDASKEHVHGASVLFCLLQELFCDCSSMFIFAHRDALLRLASNATMPAARVLRLEATRTALTDPFDCSTLLRNAITLMSSVSPGTAAADFLEALHKYCFAALGVSGKSVFDDRRKPQQSCTWPAPMRQFITDSSAGFGLVGLFGHCCLSERAFLASRVTEMMQANSVAKNKASPTSVIADADMAAAMCSRGHFDKFPSLMQTESNRASYLHAAGAIPYVLTQAGLMARLVAPLHPGTNNSGPPSRGRGGNTAHVPLSCTHAPLTNTKDMLTKGSFFQMSSLNRAFATAFFDAWVDASQISDKAVDKTLLTMEVVMALRSISDFARVDAHRQLRNGVAPADVVPSKSIFRLDQFAMSRVLSFLAPPKLKK